MDPITGYIVATLIGLALQAGTTLLGQWFGSKSDSTSGMRGQYSTGGTVNMTIVLGTYGVAGQLEYSNTWGDTGKTPNAYLTDVISLSDYRITAVSAQWIDSDSITVPSTGLVTQGYPIVTPAKFSGYAWNLLHKGDQSAVDAYLLAKFGADAERPWLSDMIGEGIAYAIQTARINETLWNDFPRYMYEVQGAPVFNLRASTAAGGSGSQVWGTFSTYAFSDNPIVLIYNILRGLHDADGNFIWGGHAEAYQLPYAEWAAAADLCDELVDLAAGGTEKRYRAGIEISLNERPADIVRELLIACNARMSFARGQYHILVDVPASADASFTDGDLLIEQAIDFSQFPNLDDALNGATATYLEPSRAWEERETAPYYRSDLETEDGQLNRESMGLRCVFSGTQAQRILKAVIEESRRFKRAVVCLPPTFGAYRPLQVLSWTSTEFQYSSKLFLITNRTTDEWGRVWFALLEIDPADFDWDEETDETALTFASTEPTAIPVQEADDFDANPTTFVDNDGTSRRPGIMVTFAADLDDVRAVRVVVYLDGESDVVFEIELTYDATSVTDIPLPKEFLPATDYEVTGQYIPFDGSGRTTNPSSRIAVTTPNITLRYVDFDPSVKERVDWLATSVKQHTKMFQETVLRVRDQSQIAQGAYDELRRTLKLQRGTDVAYFDEQIALGIAYTDAGVNAVALDLAALGLEVTDLDSGLQATIDSLDATILTVTGQGDTLTAQGTLIDAIDATLGAVSAGAKFFAEVKTTAAGYDASIGFGAYGSNGTTKGEAAIIADATNAGVGRIRLIGQRVVFSDSGGSIYAMFDSTGRYFKVDNIEANSLLVNKLEIAARGLTFEDITFEHNVTTVGSSAVSNNAAWTAGTVRYINDAGSVASAAISAGNTGTWSSGVIYIYWVKGATSFSTTTTAATAYAAGNVVVATYQGGAKLVVTWGKLVIDGSNAFKLASLDTASITNNAVTIPSHQPVADYVYNNAGTGKTSEDTIATASFTPEGGQVLVIAQGKARVTANNSAAWGNFDIKLKRAGSLIETYAGVTYDENGVGQETDGPFLFAYVDTSPGTSSVSWTMTATGLGANSARWSQLIDLSFTFIGLAK